MASEIRVGGIKAKDNTASITIADSTGIVTLSGNLLMPEDGTKGIFGSTDTDTGIRWEGTNVLAFDTGGTERLKIDASGNFTGSATNDISDQSLKENIATIADALTKIEALTGRTFTWKEEAKQDLGVHYGLIAQEVEKVIPEIVFNKSGIRTVNKITGEIAGDNEKGENFEYAKSIKTSDVIPILIEAVKALSAKVTALENA